jgi:hypothetical protein
MKRFALLLAMLLTFGVRPQSLEASSQKCYWVWQGSYLEYDLYTGAYTKVVYYRWFCDGQLSPP